MFMICLAALAGLLVIGALIDIDCRRLPNWLTSAIAALYGPYVLVSPQPVDWLSALSVAGLIFALGFAAFAFQLMGGGDVKLIAGLTLWAGPDHIAEFLFITSLAGGALALVMLMLRRWASLVPLLTIWLPAPNLVTRKPFGPTSAASGSAPAACTPTSTEPVARDDMLSLPYGVAIAAGGFAVIYALLQL